MTLELRDAGAGDLRDLCRVGERAGSHDVDPHYFAFVASEGRLVVAVDGARVIGYAGSVPVGDTTMITDLFVDPSAQGSGIGRALAREVIDDPTRVQTCSSRHPAALRVYRGLGLEVHDRLLYLEGVGTGGGGPLGGGRWAHGRVSLVEYFRSTGAIVTPDVVVRVDAATVAVEVVRLEHPDPIATLQTVLRSHPAGRVIRACVPESSPLARWMTAHGFDTLDHDLVMAAPGRRLDEAASIVHPGLW